MSADLPSRIAARLTLPVPSVAAAVELLEQGATVPFIARYRKERTNNLDEVAIRAIAEHTRRLRDLDERRGAITEGLQRLGKLTDAIAAQLAACETRAELEEIWAPYKSKRATRADAARERGLAPLAERILAQPAKASPAEEARRYIDAEKGVADEAEAIAYARDIVAEKLATEPEIVAMIRKGMREHGTLTSVARKDRKDPKDTPPDERFRDYDGREEPIAKVASHRYLAMARGEAEGALRIKVELDPERAVENVLRRVPFAPASPYGPALRAAAEDAVKRLMLPAAERAIRAEHATRAEDDALDVFERNLSAILLAAPLGPKAVLGIDPGLRTGCKCALVAETGALLEHRVLPLATGDHKGLARWLTEARPEAIAVGSGTGGREALAAARKAVKEAGIEAVVVSVSESGASVYSASDLAREELPDLDLTIRSAVHIARRLQDPLAELVKVPPQSLGVGQYQHDVDSKRLESRLQEVVESCVNRVGVDANTASPALLSYVSGVGPKLAKAIVAYREKNGPFPSRAALREVPGIGPKTFEQCAGFLRVRGKEPLDASGVHPERYPLVRRMAKDAGLSPADLVGNADAVRKIPLSRYRDEQTHTATLEDIAGELMRPGRDPRSEFEPPSFRDDVREIADLQVGMTLSGVVTNVTSFGAFVDIGVHQDGLIHVSEISDAFVRSPHDALSPGQSLTVRVIAVDLPRKRISLSAKKG